MLRDAALRTFFPPASARPEWKSVRGSAAVCSIYAAGLFFLLLATAFPATAQQSEAGFSAPDSLQKSISLPADSLDTLDTIPLEPWVIPSSIRIIANGRPVVKQGNWQYDGRRNRIRFLSKEALREAPDGITLELEIFYQRWPTSLQQAYFRRELLPAAPDSAGLAAIGADTLNAGDAGLQMERRRSEEDLFGDTQLQRSGSISRGLTVGSDQDASLESGLRFELSGNITEDIELTASLTDQNTPIQPDGSTQNIREFDTIFMRLRHEKGQIQLGDIDVGLRRSEFARINRRLQGAEVQLSASELGQYSASAAVVPGRFRRMEFSGREGVQGPYRLTGNENEPFIIIQAGTEQIYLNGELLKRGEENDYIIDYALGELRFTNTRIIGSESRIAAEFQYVTEAFNRTLLTAEADYDQFLDGRLSVGASFIREADSRDLNAEFGLSEEEVRILEEVGADLDAAVVSGADSVGFRASPDYIPYARIDTTFAGEEFRIFRAAPGERAGVWRVRFSRVGEGSGSYRRAENALNGIVYEWAGPGQGSYEPFRRVPAPEEQQMISLRSRYRLSETLEVFGETAVSQNDVNRFSEASETRSEALAYLGGIRLNPTETRLGDITARVQHEETGAGFSFFDRTRDIEFERRWNIPESEENELSFTSGFVKLDVSDFSSFEADGGRLSRPGFESWRGGGRLRLQEANAPELDYRLDWVTSRLSGPGGRETRWLRQRWALAEDVRLAGIGLRPGFSGEQETRRQYLPESAGTPADSLTAGAFRFIELQPELRLNLTRNLQLSSSYRYRNDETVAKGAFSPEAITRTLNQRLRYQPSERATLTGGITYRTKRLQRAGQDLDSEAELSTFLLNATADYAAASGWLETGWAYEAGTEQQPLLQETYIEVGPELGNYVWDDLNGDGAQQLDEFFPAQNPNEGRFVQRFIPGDDLFSTVRLDTRLQLRLRPGEQFEGTVWPHVQLRSTVNLREENREAAISELLLLRPSAFRADTGTIEGRLSWQHELQLFEPWARIDARIRYNSQTGLNRRASGVEEQQNRRTESEFSYRISRQLRSGISGGYGSQKLESGILQNRNYDIRSVDAEPYLRYVFSRSLHATGGLGWARKRDVFPADEVVLRRYKVFTDFRWFYRNDLQTSGRVEYRQNELEGLSSSFGAFELTDGAGAGQSWQWNLQMSWRINTYLRANLRYDARTRAERPLLQTLNFTVNAVF
jgi:hypothetical protein